MKNKFFKKCLEIAVIVIGNAILAFGICAFITPHGIIVGGASGLGLIVKQITGIPLSKNLCFKVLPNQVITCPPFSVRL